MRSRRFVGWVALGATGLLTACIEGGAARPVDSRSDERIITVFGPYRDVDADRFAASLEGFERTNDVDVRFTGTADFVAELQARTGPGGDPPDVAIVPQLGLVRDLALDEAIVPLSTATRSELAAHHTVADRELGVVDGVVYAVPFRVNVKSLVWFRPSVFEERGWAVPETFDELQALVDQIEQGGELAPWCLTLQAGSATGWPATDWVEDLLLRLSGSDVYERWTNGQLAFASPPVQAAFDTFDELVLEPGRLTGGVRYALDNPTVEIFERMLGSSPRCAMAKQADFAANWLPEGTTIGADGDVDWFVLPGVRDGPAPLVIGGDLAVQLDDAPEVDALLTYLAGPDGASVWARLGGLITPVTSFDLDDYPDDASRALGELYTSAEAVEFDASDGMPSAVGSQAFWSLISQWVADVVSFDTLAIELDEAYAGELGLDPGRPAAAPG
jgi:alpha-glucoside transport system substrate-binding protein